MLVCLLCFVVVVVVFVRCCCAFCGIVFSCYFGGGLVPFDVALG